MPFDPVGFLAVLLIFGSGGYAVKRIFDLKEKRLEGKDPASKKELEQLKQDRKLLQERVENLESIVCNVDYELNIRLAEVAAEHSRAALPPAAAEAGEATGGAPPVEPSARTLTAGRAGLGELLAKNPRAAGQGGGVGATLEAKAAAVRELATPAAFAIGDTVSNRYRIDRLLGRGGMGAVYLAFDEVLSEQVALKVISPLWGHDQRALIERFRREASAARKISSPNVIRIHDLGETSQGLMFISMEYIAGKTLAELLTAKGTLGKRELPDIVGQICDGLTAAHDAGVIHRDLKPQNIIIGERSSVKIIDFGLAKTAVMSGMTATGLMLGTPYYMSPEQVRGKEVDARSDIYSLGALTYHAVTGKPPFDGDTPIAIGFAHCTEPPIPPREVNEKVSQQLSDMIIDALAKEPGDRPQSAAEFREAL